ncbi:MAG: hypothetical protein ACO1NX_01655 [Chitinophagaceae bacterium]
MTRYHFNILEEGQRVRLVRQKGVQVGERAETFHTVLLYQLDSFYVELHHHNHFNVITHIESFSDTARLQPYLQQISLEGLV